MLQKRSSTGHLSHRIMAVRSVYGKTTQAGMPMPRSWSSFWRGPLEVLESGRVTGAPGEIRTPDLLVRSSTVRRPVLTPWLSRWLSESMAGRPGQEHAAALCAASPPRLAPGSARGSGAVVLAPVAVAHAPGAGRAVNRQPACDDSGPCRSPFRDGLRRNTQGDGTADRGAAAPGGVAGAWEGGLIG